MKAVIRAMQKLEEWDVYLQYATTIREVLSQCTADLAVMTATEGSEEAAANKTALEEKLLPEAERRWAGIQKVLVEHMGCQTTEEAIEKFEKAAAAVELYRTMRKKYLSYQAAYELEVSLGLTAQKRREIEEALSKLRGDLDEQANVIGKQLQISALVLT